MKLRFAAAAVLLLAGCGGSSSPIQDAAPAGDALVLLHATRGANPGIYDAAGRQVILRGVNYGALGDYYIDQPAYPAPVRPRPDDFAQMAALGLNSIRLIVHWSRLEPEPGVYDESYIGEIRAQIEKAARYGIYVVVDMHQDAWGKYIATREAGDTCLAPLEPSLGWDGAPQWATLTDGLTTCHVQQRELSPAVSQAFTNFYLDRNGIQAHFVATWAHLASSVAGYSNVAGYDLLNEPNPGYLVGVNGATLLAALYTKLIDAIRTAEHAKPGAMPHIVFFEPSIEWSLLGYSYTLTPLPNFTADANIVFAPHNYCGSLAVTPQDFCFQSSQQVADSYGVTFWSGEWGCFGDPASCLAHVTGFGQQEDASLTGSALWQWAQACGDPHSIGSPGAPVGKETLLLKHLGCPGDVDLGYDATNALVVSRSYPRAAPGRLTAISSNASSGALDISGTAPAPGVLDVWVPERIGTPAVDTQAGAVEIVRVDGGFRIHAQVSGTYRLRISASQD